VRNETVLAILIIATLIEIGVIVYMYLNSDMIECNWLFCTFTTTRRNTTIYKSCYENGIQINCSDIT
jgi:hypothetical protein